MYTTRNRRRHQAQITCHPGVGNLLTDFFNTAIGEVPDKVERKRYSNPLVNVIEHEDKYEMHVALPGFSKEDIEITINEDVLSLKAKESEAQKINFRLREFNYSGFNKNFRLPESVDTAAISATATDGILTLVLPKREDAIPQPPRNIDIK